MIVLFYNKINTTQWIPCFYTNMLYCYYDINSVIVLNLIEIIKCT